MAWTLNRRALSVAETLATHPEDYRTAVRTIEGGGRYIDCGIESRGSLLAGIEVARVCLGGLGQVSMLPGEVGGRSIPVIQVVTDHPVRACLASQYAGWAIQDGKYFAMGSGPMRAAAGSEAIYEAIDFRESAPAIVGVLETRKPPPPVIFAKIAAACRVEPAALTLLAAPTASLAGGVQIVARSVETALHKLHELKFDLTRIVSAYGTAPLPPVADNDLAAIGRTNDSILYGARVLLYVTGDDASLEAIGPQVPSSASHDYGEPFAAIFARYNNDFYKVDPHLFSPAEVSFQNLDSGKVHSFGRLNPDVLGRSFGFEGRESMKTLVALVSGLGWHVADLHRAAGRLEVALHAIPFSDVSASVELDRRASSIRAGGLDLLNTDGVLVRMMPPGSLEQVVFRMDALHRVAASGVPVLNPPRAVEAAVDKYLSLAKLSASGLPVPATWAGQSATAALTAFEALGGDVVVKPLFGSEGRGLLRISDRELAWRTFHTLERLGAILYLQQFVRHPGHDLRVFVLKGSVLGAMRRHATSGEWRTNVSLGGRAEPCRLDAEAERLAIDSARVLGAEMAGVDLIPDADRARLTLLEVNAVPGWRALSRVTGLDVAAAVIETLRNSRGSIRDHDRA